VTATAAAAVACAGTRTGVTALLRRAAGAGTDVAAAAGAAAVAGVGAVDGAGEGTRAGQGRGPDSGASAAAAGGAAAEARAVHGTGTDGGADATADAGEVAAAAARQGTAPGGRTHPTNRGMVARSASFQFSVCSRQYRNDGSDQGRMGWVSCQRRTMNDVQLAQAKSEVRCQKLEVRSAEDSGRESLSSHNERRNDGRCTKSRGWMLRFGVVASLIPVKGRPYEENDK